jgi:hypothetical protein
MCHEKPPVGAFVPDPLKTNQPSPVNQTTPILSPRPAFADQNVGQAFQPDAFEESGWKA